MIGKSQTTGTCNHWMKFQIAKPGESVLKQRGESLADIGIVSLIIGEQYICSVSKIAILTVVEPISIPNV